MGLILEAPWGCAVVGRPRYQANVLAVAEQGDGVIKYRPAVSDITAKREKRETEHKVHTQIRTLESNNRVLQRGLDSANSFIASNREVNIAERAELRMQAEEALMQLQANERQMSKHDDEVNAIVAERNALKLELLERDHTISDLQLEVANHDAHEQNLRQCNSELRARNRDLRLRNGELRRQQETDAVTLFCANMVLLRRHEQPLAFPSGNTIATAQPAVTA